MVLGKAIEKYKEFKFPSLSVIREKISHHQKTCILIVIIAIILSLIFIYISLFWVPHRLVAQFGISNSTNIAQLENSYRATIAQILGGSVVVIGIYFAWENLTTVREGQITERFTRAIDQLGALDQLGNTAIEIRLGGIYALERISTESEKDYWPIMEILTAYIRKNSSIDIIQFFKKEDSLETVPISMDIQANESTKNKDSNAVPALLDIQAILTVIARRKYSCGHGETKRLNLELTNLSTANLSKANLSGAYLSGTNLFWAKLEEANLTKTRLVEANLSKANLYKANLSGAYLSEANLSEANLIWANLSSANLSEANLSGASLISANLSSANLSEANLSGAYLTSANLTSANLTSARLREADLSKTDLTGANLSGANLSGANLSGANLTGANLKVYFNLTINQLSKVKTLYNAELNEKLLISLKEKYPALLEKPN